MTAENVIDDVRDILRDTVATYRWANSVLFDFVSAGMRDLWQRRTDARFASDGSYTAALTIPTMSGETVPTDTLVLDNVFREALVYYTAHRAFGINGDDEANAALADRYLLMYERELKVK